MLLDILPLAGGAARLVRVYGGEPCAVLPGAVPGPEGGEWPITELGDYCFSEKPRGLPGPEKTCRYNVDNMEETTSVLALGSGGISKCVMREEEKILRAPNIANIEQYIDRVDEMIERKREAFAVKAAKLQRD